MPSFEGTKSEVDMQRYLYYKTHYFDHLPIGDQRVLRSPLLHDRLEYYVEKLTPQEPDSINVALDYIFKKLKILKRLLSTTSFIFSTNMQGASWLVLMLFMSILWMNITVRALPPGLMRNSSKNGKMLPRLGLSSLVKLPLRSNSSNIRMKSQSVSTKSTRRILFYLSGTPLAAIAKQVCLL